MQAGQFIDDLDMDFFVHQDFYTTEEDGSVSFGMESFDMQHVTDFEQRQESVFSDFEQPRGSMLSEFEHRRGSVLSDFEQRNSSQMSQHVGTLSLSDDFSSHEDSSSDSNPDYDDPPNENVWKEIARNTTKQNGASKQNGGQKQTRKFVPERSAKCRPSTNRSLDVIASTIAKLKQENRQLQKAYVDAQLKMRCNQRDLDRVSAERDLLKRKVSL